MCLDWANCRNVSSFESILCSLGLEMPQQHDNSTDNQDIYDPYISAGGFSENLMVNVGVLAGGIGLICIGQLIKYQRREHATWWEPVKSAVMWIPECIRGPRYSSVQPCGQEDFLDLLSLLLKLNVLLSVFSVLAAFINSFTNTNLNADWFERTTMNNLNPESWMAWYQIILVVVPATWIPLHLILSFVNEIKSRHSVEPVVVLSPSLVVSVHTSAIQQNLKRSKWLGINAFLLLMCVVGSVIPIIIYTCLIRNVRSNSNMQHLKSYLAKWLPAVLSWLFVKIISIIIIFSAYHGGKRNKWELMVKHHWIVFLSYAILPSLGFSTLMSLLVKAEDINKWRRIFLPDNGAYFVNYVVSMALTGGAFDLLAVQQVILYVIFVCWWKLQHGIGSVYPHKFQWLNPEYFEEEMARALAIFALVAIYCISCPLITFGGIVYLLVKIWITRFHFSHTSIDLSSNLTGQPCDMKKTLGAGIIILCCAYPILTAAMLIFSFLSIGLRGITLFILVTFVLSFVPVGIVVFALSGNLIDANLTCQFPERLKLIFLRIVPETWCPQQ